MELKGKLIQLKGGKLNYYLAQLKNTQFTFSSMVSPAERNVDFYFF